MIVASPPASGLALPGEGLAGQDKGENRASVQEVLVRGSREAAVTSIEPERAMNVEFILDASGSMLERVGGRPKIEVANEVMGKLVSELPAALNLGLRVYGHRYSEADKVRSCQDVQLLAPLGPDNAKKLVQELAGIQASGWSPMALALELAAQDMAPQGQGINSVVLLSDGQETCGGLPRQVAQEQKERPLGLTVHTIGFAIDEEARQELQEVARVSGGSYHEAQDARGLLSALEGALAAARSGTFLRAEVEGEEGRRVSASVWLQDPRTGGKLHEFRSWTDSPVAPGVYDILVGTVPRLIYPGWEIGSHTRTTLRVGTGALRVELSDVGGEPLRVPAHLKDRATGATLRSFSTWHNQPVLPGIYDLEVEANPALKRRGIVVAVQSLSLVSLGKGSLRLEFTSLGGGQPNWEAELRDPDTGQAVYRAAVGREQSVMAGPYRLVILSVPQISMEVRIEPGEARVIRAETGYLRVELSDSSGQRMMAPATLSGKGQGEAGRFFTWQDTFPLPGFYELTVGAAAEVRRQVQVSATEPTVLRLRWP